MKTTKNKRQTKASKKSYQPHIVALGIVSVLSSFALGINTAGDVETIHLTEAETTVLSGDMNLDGLLTIQDAILLLEIAEGYAEATPEQLLRDPNENGQLTTEDAMTLLNVIASY